VEQLGVERYEGLRDLDALYRFFYTAKTEEIEKDLQVFAIILK